MRRTAAASALASALLLPGCGGPPEPPARRSQPASEVAATRVPPGRLPAAEARPFLFPDEGESLYGVEGVPADLSRRAAARASARLGVAVEPDACLERAAALLLRRAAPGCALWGSWLEEPVLHHAGCYDGGTTSFLFCSDDDDESEALEEVERALGSLDRRDLSHIGMARRRGEAYDWAWAVLMADRRLQLATFPRTLPVGGRVVLEGTLQVPDEEVTAWLMTPGGEVRSLPLRRSGGGRFSVPVSGLSRPGEFWLELMLIDRSGPHVAALFPVYVGRSPPEAVVPPPPVDIEADTPEAGEALLFELVNLERGQRGLPLLSYDPFLAPVARDHARAMRDSGFFAHRDPVGRGPRERAEARGYHARVLGENLARAPRILAAHEDLMGSPTHRANLLDPRFTHVGIGVVEGGGPDGRLFWVVENFSLPYRDLTPEEAAREAARVVEDRAEARGVRLDRVRALDRVVEALVGEAATSSLHYLNEVAARELRRRGVTWRSQTLVRHVVADPADLPELPGSAWEKDRYGLALARETPAEGPPRYVLLFLFLR